MNQPETASCEGRLKLVVPSSPLTGTLTHASLSPLPSRIIVILMVWLPNCKNSVLEGQIKEQCCKVGTGTLFP